MQPHPFLVALVSVLLSTLGQFALKLGTSRAQASPDASAGPGLSFSALIMKSLLEPAVWIGIALYAAGALLWIYVLARWDLSKAYPLLGLGVVLSLLAGSLILGERVTPERWLGCGFVFVGLLLIVRS